MGKILPGGWCCGPILCVRWRRRLLRQQARRSRRCVSLRCHGTNWKHALSEVEAFTVFVHPGDPNLVFAETEGERRGTQTETANLFGRFAATSSPATKSSLSAARCATAAAILQKALHILPPIVVGNLLPGLDSA
jgi:hypothetical protein